MAEYLMYKDCAKILYNLYYDCFNRYSRIAISMEVGESERKKFFHLCSRISLEEIWAYSKNVIDLSSYDSESSTYTNILDLKREWKIGKREFLNIVFTPVIKIFRMQKIVYVREIDDFILEMGLGKGIFENTMQFQKWLLESEKIIGNIKKYLKCNN